METIEKEPKKYLYHMLPQDMVGTTLHPLTKLKDIHPELHALKIRKYDGREEVMENFIPTLECKWNDVLQFSPIHPNELKQALQEAGFDLGERKFIEIDPDLLDPSKTTIFLFNTVGSGDPIAEEFVDYDPDDIVKHSVLNEMTKRLWKESVSSGHKPFLFIGIPHILHKGSIDISEMRVITV